MTKFTVALVGGDGAGKTTVAKHLEKSLPFPVKYIYMGLSPQANDFTLPTTRAIQSLKRRSYRKKTQNMGNTPHENVPAQHMEYGQIKRGPLILILRFINRLVDAWYRQFISFFYRLRGYSVLYDRHFLFDTAPESVNIKVSKKNWLDELYYLNFRYLFPKPDLTIFLDAPANMLYERKGESSPDYLKRRRGAILKLSETMGSFMRVDATQPLTVVLEEVTQHLMDHYESEISK